MLISGASFPFPCNGRRGVRFQSRQAARTPLLVQAERGAAFPLPRRSHLWLNKARTRCLPPPQAPRWPSPCVSRHPDIRDGSGCVIRVLAGAPSRGRPARPPAAASRSGDVGGGGDGLRRRAGRVVRTHRWHPRAHTLPAHPALYLEPSLGMQTCISGLSATQTKKKKGTRKTSWVPVLNPNSKREKRPPHRVKHHSFSGGRLRGFSLLVLMRKTRPTLWTDVLQRRKPRGKCLWKGQDVSKI